MTLTDAGPLVALIDRGDNGHAACTVALPRLAKPMVTTWPCYTEAMHLLGRSGGFSFQDKLWRLYNDDLLTIHELSHAEIARMRVLMAKYHDTPMDLADASLVAAAETLGVTRIFSIDSDFVVYRLHDNTKFTIIP